MGTQTHLKPSACTAAIAHRSHIVANMNIHVLHMGRYIRYVRYIRYCTPRTRTPPGFAKSAIDGRAIRGRIAPDGAAAARHRAARVASWLGAATAAGTRLGERLRHHAAAVEHRLERGDERLRGGVVGGAPTFSEPPPRLATSMASTAPVAKMMRSSSEMAVLTYTMLAACDAQQSHSR